MDSLIESIAKNDEDVATNKTSQLLSILDKSLRIDEAFVIDDSTAINIEVIKNCKILKICSKFTFDEALSKLESLRPEQYPNLFIFVIEIKNIELNCQNFEILRRILNRFDADRPLVLQLTSEGEKITKFYYKNENSSEFIEIDKNQRNFEKFLNFPSFLCSTLDGNVNSCLNLVLDKLPNLNNSSTILKFLQLFELSEEFLDKLVLKCAAIGSKSDLLAALDASFEGGMRALIIDAQNYLSYLINVELPSNSKESKDNQGDAQNKVDYSSLYPSILSTAVDNKNTEIIDYLISNCTHLIQQLPFNHQVRVSTAALATQQLDVLCDLLEISDFSFPSNFEIQNLKHERLDRIITDRTNFHCAIKSKNIEQISKFIDNNLSLKIVYNPANSSALKQAITLKRYKIFYYLKSLGFQAHDVNIDKELNSKELKKANNFKSQQMISNVNCALNDQQFSVNLLCNKSFIHNKRISKDQEAEYRRKIRKWYEDINKVQFGSDLVNVAASCKDLKVIFDFEDKSVENASLSGPGSLGSTYPTQKWIFIGAKSTDNDRDQKIKGVLAHELCHYVMKLVYENSENPYYKHCKEAIEKFEEIVTFIDKWSATKSDQPDDECDKIISSVFTHYKRTDCHPELIVRVVQILAQYDDDQNKSNYLNDKYKELFEYFRIYVWPEMQKFNLKFRENVRKMNRTLQLLPWILNCKLEVVAAKNIEDMMTNDVTIVSTNIPKLFLVDLVNQLHGTYGEIFKAQNIFIDPKRFENSEILEDLKQLLSQNENLNIFYDFSKEFCEDLDIFIGKESLRFIFIVSSKSQQEKLTQIIANKSLNPTNLEVNYNWTDLTLQSQKKLQQTRINFQNNTNFNLYDVLKIDSDDNETKTVQSTEEDEAKVVQMFSEIVDTEILNLILENSPIPINLTSENTTNDKTFKFLFQPRDFIYRHPQKDIKTFKISKITQPELIQQVKDNKYVLISDIAGSGKSWVMKNLTKTLHQKHLTKWMTYVDLKHFIKDFRTQKANPDFCEFLVEKILKLKSDKFEAKLLQKMYKLGKVFILFDGFDEIAPDCAELVSKLAQSFQKNGGNQLWIATRDYFEVDLQKELGESAAYKLSSFTDKDGVDFIVKSWILKELEADSKDDFEKFIKNSKNLEIYHQNARRIVNKVVTSDSKSVGMPQLFKMIAEIFKDTKHATITIKKFIIYKTFAKMLYERWSSAKGAIRKRANTESQDYDLTFQKFHQFSALKKLVADLVDELFPDCHESEWPDAEVIACGLMTKIGDEFYFLHETFCEFYVADYIVGILTKKAKFKEEFCELLARVLTMKKFEMVREFLSDGIDDYSVLEKIQGRMRKQIEYFNEMTNFHHYFLKFNEHFGCFVIEILKNGDYKKVRGILFNTAEVVCSDAENSELYAKYQDFMVDFLTADDLKKLIDIKLVLHRSIQSSRDVKIFENFLNKVAAKTSKEFIQNSLKLVSSDGFEDNIFSFLVKSSTLDANKMNKLMKIIQNHLEPSEISDLMKNCNKNQENVLQICIQTGNKEKLQVIWSAVQNTSNFREIIKKIDLKKKSILDNARTIHNLNFQEVFLQLLTKSFDNPEELLDFLLQKDFNFIHDLIEKDEDTQLIELTLNILKAYFTASQFQQILLQKYKRDRNLLQMAGFKSKRLQTHQFLWQLYRDSFQDDQDFLDVIKQVDFFGNNIIQIAVYELPNEFFDFMLNELEKICRPDEIIKILSNINKWNRNVLQSESKWTKSAELHANLWTKFRRYFKSEDILEFIEHVDKFGNHLLFNAVENNKKEFVELIWMDIRSFMSRDEQIRYLKAENNDGKNLLQMSFGNKEYFNEVYEWVKEVMADYEIQLETMTRKKLLTEKYPVQKCCRTPKWVCKLDKVEEEI